MVSLTSTLIFWVIYGLLLDAFDVRVFAFVISTAGFLLALSVFFLYGVEEVPHPVGAIVFHAGGIAGSLGIGLFSLFPLLILHQTNTVNPAQKTAGNAKPNDTPPEPELESDDWEFATEEELKAIDKRVKKRVAECEKFAEESDFPEKEVMYDVVYEQEDYPFLAHKPE